MKIQMIVCVFPPEPVVSAQIGIDVAVYLSRRSHAVKVIAPQPSRVTVSPPISAGGDARMRFALRRCRSFVYSGKSVLLRALESVAYGCCSSWAMTTETGGADVRYINTWPVFGQLFAVLAAKAEATPYVLHIQDLYPEVLSSRLGPPGRELLNAFGRSLDAWMARGAAVVVVVSESMRDTYTEDRRVAPTRVAVCPNWQDETRFVEMVERSHVESRYAVRPGRFTFMFLGNIGTAAGVDCVIRAFAAAEIPNAQLLIIGEGTEKDACMKLAKELHADDVQFISDPDVRNVPALQAMADVFLLPLRDNVGGTSIPSKLIAYLFSGKPILATVDGSSDIARYIREGQCGWIGKPGDTHWLSEQMRHVASLDGGTLTAMGNAARVLGENRFSRRRGLPTLARIIEASASRPSVVI